MPDTLTMHASRDLELHQRNNHCTPLQTVYTLGSES